MSMVSSIYTSAYYLQKWKEVEDKIADEIELVAVKIAENGDDKLEFHDDRMKGLQKLADYYKGKYEKAYKKENGLNSTNRLKTYNNGL